MVLRAVMLWRAELSWGLFSLLMCGCSLAFDVDRVQCNAPADCMSRGLGNTCVAHLCQAAPPSAGDGSIASGIQGSGGAGAPAAATETAGTSAGSGGTSTSTAGASAGSGGAAGTPTAGARAGQSGSIATGAAGASGAAGCSGDSCGECSVDDDCERRGVSGGKCVDMKCFAPKPECEKDDDCLTMGPEFMGGRCLDHRCLPNPMWRCEPTPPPPVGDTGMTKLVLPVIDAISLAPVTNSRLSACNKLDLVCGSPVVTTTTDSKGELTIDVPPNFLGYVQQIDNASYANALYFLPPVLPSSGRLQNFPLIASGPSLDALALGLNATLDAARGHLILVVVGCDGVGLAGVKFSTPQADKSTTAFYVRGQLPTTTATDTPVDGDGGFLNIVPGTVVITATDVKTGVEINTVTVLVRAGFITTTYIRPYVRGDQKRTGTETM